MKLHKNIQGDGPLLVLLHGWGFSHHIWQDLVPSLAKHYTVMSIDLPGFGASPLAENINSLNTFSEAVLNEIPGKAILLGWSLGGLVAQYLAIHHPEQVENLILVATSPHFIKETAWPGIDSDLLKSFAKELESDYQKLLQRFLALQFFGVESDRALIKRLSTQIIQERPDLKALHLGLELLLHSDLRTELNHIQPPLRFILGKLDVLVPVSLVEVLANLNSNIHIEVIKGAGHAPFISHPDAFLTATGLLP